VLDWGWRGGCARFLVLSSSSVGTMYGLDMGGLFVLFALEFHFCWLYSLDCTDRVTNVVRSLLELASVEGVLFSSSCICLVGFPCRRLFRVCNWSIRHGAEIPFALLACVLSGRNKRGNHRERGGECVHIYLRFAPIHLPTTGLRV